MSTDRELLELAAKAAGMKLGLCAFAWDDDAQGFHRHEPDSSGISGPWSPLTDDGDALRLALDIGLVVDTRYKDSAMRAFNSVCYWLSADDTGMAIEFGPHEKHELGEVARRTIVRAAAEIGRAM